MQDSDLMIYVLVRFVALVVNATASSFRATKADTMMPKYCDNCFYICALSFSFSLNGLS